MCQKANFELKEDMRAALDNAERRETNPLAMSTLNRILENADIASARSMPMCQDTGMVVVFAAVGQEVRIVGGLLEDAINAGVRRGYKEGFLRASITADPWSAETPETIPRRWSMSSWSPGSTCACSFWPRAAAART